MQYNRQQILEIVNTQLLLWIKKDEAVRGAVFELVDTKYPTKKETDDKFEKMLKTFSQEQANDRESQEKKWNENQIVIEKILRNIEELNKKFVVNIGSIGSRWGMAAELSFRDGLKSILETDFPVKVINYNKMDNDCLVYKRPMPVEIDVIIHNGKKILCEISASFSRDEVDAFAKKIDFYERKEKVKVTRAMIISPMGSPQALEEAKHYGIEVFTYPEKKMF